jgi:hypothetical protein
MNNYWGTNYKATQEGKTTFRYYLIPHDSPDRAAIKRHGNEMLQPLLALEGSLGRHKTEKIPYPENNDLMVTFVRPVNGGLLMRIFNPSEKACPLVLKGAGPDKEKVFLTGPMGQGRKPLPEKKMLHPYDFVTVLIEK